MTPQTTDLQHEVDERKRAAHAAELRADQARLLAANLDDLRRDITRLVRRRDTFAALGAGHIEFPETRLDPRYNVEFALEPRRSRLTGAELAAGVEVSINHLQREAAKVERDIKKLLAG